MMCSDIFCMPATVHLEISSFLRGLVMPCVKPYSIIQVFHCAIRWFLNISNIFYELMSMEVVSDPYIDDLILMTTLLSKPLMRQLLMNTPKNIPTWLTLVLLNVSQWNFLLHCTSSLITSPKTLLKCLDTFPFCNFTFQFMLWKWNRRLEFMYIYCNPGFKHCILWTIIVEISFLRGMITCFYCCSSIQI